MADLRNTIAHILEHKEQLVDANEATIQQYVVLPILRALGWDDTNLASMEIQPEYKVESRRADYALHTQQEQSPVVLIECKRWNQPIGRNEKQICFYAYSGNVPLAIITNGKLWRFYLSRWEAPSLSDRIFCETDIEGREVAISNLEKYLLKSNVVSAEAELNAEIALEEKVEVSKPRPTDSEINDVSNVIDSQSATKQVVAPSEFSGEWTAERIRNLVSEEIRDYHEANFPEERCNVFYGRVAEIQNLIEAEGWRLKPPKFNKQSCSFQLMDRGITRIRRVFALLLHAHLPHGRPVDRNGEKINLSIKSNPPRILAPITVEEAMQLERQYRCEFWCIDRGLIYYNIPDDITELRPVLEFAYNKHQGK